MSESIYNISSPELISYNKIINAIKKITGLKCDVISMATDQLIAHKIPLPYPIDEHLVYSGDLFCEHFDFSYLGFEEGLRRTYEHFINYRVDHGRSS